MRCPQAGETYKHYKGGEYKIIAIARHTETEEELVIYQALGYPEKIWARPMPMFLETIEKEGEHIPRFSLKE